MRGGKAVIDYDKLRGALAEKRITQAEIASSLGCSRQAISNKMTGKNSLTVRDVTAIVNLIEADADTIKDIFFAEGVK